MGLNLLLVFIPIAVALDWYGASPVAVFVASALAIVPLAGLMGRATEQLSVYVGTTIGGLLSASLGNAPELIISGFALKEGPGRCRQGVDHRLDSRQYALLTRPVDDHRRVGPGTSAVQSNRRGHERGALVRGGGRAADSGHIPFCDVIKSAR